MFALLLLFVKTILLIKFVSSGVIMDSESVDNKYVTFRKNRCYNSADEQEKQFYMLTGSPYQKYIRPGQSSGENSTSPLIYINVSLDMNSLASVDDINSEYSLILNLELEWFDERLKFDCHNQLALISIDPFQHQRIWTPKLGVPNVKEPGSLEVSGHDSVISFKIRSDGYVYLRSSMQLNLFCDLNFKNYPFDRQKCSIKLESRGLSDQQLLLQWRDENPFRNSDRFQMTGFKLFDYELFNESIQLIDLFEEDRVSRIRVVLHFQREWYHFLLDVYLPSALFVTMSWLSFWLEIAAAPARVTLGMTTMLTLVTSSLSTREKLPKVAYIHALDIWIVFCICFVFASLIEFALVSFLYRSEKIRRQKIKSLQRNLSAISLASLASPNDPMITVSKYLDVPERHKISLSVPNLADNLRRDSAESSSCTLTNSGDDTGSTSYLRRKLKIKCPNELADDIDKKCRICFPLIFAIFNIIYWTSVNL